MSARFLANRGNPHSLSWQSHSLSKPSELLLQRGNLDVHPSIRRRTRHDIAGHPIDRSKVGFVAALEVKPGSRISCTKRSNTSFGAIVGDLGDLNPYQWKAGIQRRREEGEKGDQNSVHQKRRNVEVHLMYHIDKALSVIPTEVKDHLNLLLAR